MTSTWNTKNEHNMPHNLKITVTLRKIDAYIKFSINWSSDNWSFKGVQWFSFIVLCVSVKQFNFGDFNITRCLRIRSVRNLIIMKLKTTVYVSYLLIPLSYNMLMLKKLIYGFMSLQMNHVKWNKHWLNSFSTI